MWIAGILMFCGTFSIYFSLVYYLSFISDQYAWPWAGDVGKILSILGYLATFLYMYFFYVNFFNKKSYASFFILMIISAIYMYAFESFFITDLMSDEGFLSIDIIPKFLPGNIPLLMIYFGLFYYFLTYIPNFKKPKLSKLIMFRMLIIIPVGLIAIGYLAKHFGGEFAIMKNPFFKIIFNSKSLVLTSCMLTMAVLLYLHNLYYKIKYPYKEYLLRTSGKNYQFKCNIIATVVLVITAIVCTVLTYAYDAVDKEVMHGVYLFTLVPFILFFDIKRKPQSKIAQIGFYSLYPIQYTLLLFLILAI